MRALAISLCLTGALAGCQSGAVSVSRSNVAACAQQAGVTGSVTVNRSRSGYSVATGENVSVRQKLFGVNSIFRR